MTELNYRESFRALFLTALMVISVFGGTIVFAGGAAATVTNPAFDGASTVETGGDVTITGDVDDDATDVQIYVDIDQNGEFDSGEATTVANSAFSGSFSADITAPASSGQYEVYVDQAESTLSAGDSYSSNTDASVGTLTADSDGPTFENAAPTDARTSDTDITVDISDELDSVDASSIEVSVIEDGTEVYSTTDASASFSSGTLTLEPGTGDLPELSEGSSYTVDVTAADTLGNSASTSFSFDYDATAPTFGDATVDGDGLPDSGTLTVATTTPTIAQPISDDEFTVDPESIDVTLEDGSNVIYTYSVGSETANDGVSFSGGDLVVEPGTGDVPELEAGNTYTLTVDAADTSGNSGTATVSFTVDTAAPSISNISPADDALVNDPMTSISADVGSDAETATLTIEGPDGYSATFDTSDDVFSSNEFSVTPGTTTDVAELPDGDITVSVTATDAEGNKATDSATFEVDTQGPTATDIAADFDVTNENNGRESLTVTFDEPVVPRTVDVDVNDADDNDITVLSKTGDIPSTTVVVQFGTSKQVDTEASLSVTSAEDAAGNTLAADETDTTVSVDTTDPSVGVSPFNGDGTASGYVDLTEDVSPSSEDGETVSYAVLPGGDGDYTPADDEGDLRTIDSPANLDTTTLPEGAHTLVVTVTDDAGNEVTGTAALTIDNVDPSVTFADADDMTLTGEVTLGDLVSVSDFGVEDVTVDISGPDGNFLVQASPDNLDSTTINVNEYGSGGYTVNVVADNPGYDGDSAEVTRSETFTGATLAPGTLSISTADQLHNVDVEDDESTLIVEYESSTDLDELNVTVGTSDDYVEQSSMGYTIDDFTESESGGTYTYTLAIDSERDGTYQAAFSDAKLDSKTVTADDFRGGDDTASVGVDARAVEMIDADVSGTDTGRTQVTVTLSEPVDGFPTTSFEFSDEAAGIIASSDANDGDGEQTLTFDSEIQTGTDVELEFTDQIRGDDDVVTSVVVDSVELDLTEGANLVSVPVETGEVPLDSMDLSDVNVIWAYDNGAWTSYDPAADENAFTALEGGQGYIFMAEADATVDARGYTVPAVDDDSGATPSVPTVETIEQGWNLVGHFQEGTQMSSKALTTVDSSTVPDVGPLGQSSAYSYSIVDSFDPGEAYWVFADSSDLYTAVEYAGSATTPSVSAVSAEGAADDGNTAVNDGEQVTVSATVSDASTVVASIDGVSEAVTLTQDQDGDPYTKSFDVPAEVSDVEQSLTVTAIDSIGAEATGGAEFQVNRNLDTLEITTPDETNDQAETLTVDDSVIVNANDDQAVEQLDYTIVNSGNEQEAAGQVGDDGSIPIPSGLADDVYTVTVTAVDQGDKQTTSQFRIKSDSTSSDITLNSGSLTPSAVQTGDSVSHQTEIQLSGVSNDGNTDTVFIRVPDEVANAQNFGVSSSPSSEQSSSTSSSNIVDGGDEDDVDDTIRFTISSGGGSTYDPLITLSFDTQYSTASAEFPYNVRVEDSDGDTLRSTTFATVTTDDTAPSISGATKSTSNSETTVKMTVEDTGVGLDAGTVDATDFDVTKSDGTQSIVNENGVTLSSVNDGDSTVTATITLDGDYSGDTITAEIVGDISDLAGNTVSSDSQEAT